MAEPAQTATDLPAGFAFEALPPEQAINYFRSLGIEITWDYRDLWSKEQRRAFTVAKLTQLDLLEKVRDLIDDALAKGISLRQFTESVEADLEAAGWGGALSSSRLENIYRSNLASAYSAGEWEQIQESALARAERGIETYLTYEAVGDERTREEHEERSGTTLPVNDPWWEENYPPIDYQCRCWVDESDAPALERYGVTVSERPETTYVTYRHPTTDEEIRVPMGVAPGFGRRNWDSAVGDELRRRLAAADPDLRRAIKADLPVDMVQPKLKLPTPIGGTPTTTIDAAPAEIAELLGMSSDKVPPIRRVVHYSETPRLAVLPKSPGGTTDKGIFVYPEGFEGNGKLDWPGRTRHVYSIRGDAKVEIGDVFHKREFGTRQHKVELFIPEDQLPALAPVKVQPKGKAA